MCTLATVLPRFVDEPAASTETMSLQTLIPMLRHVDTDEVAAVRRQELGIPTANLDRESLHGALAQAVSGIYLGWASVGAETAVHKMVMSIGWNPYFKNEVG